MAELSELYREVIRDHNKDPRNFREIASPDREVLGKNPMCGDSFKVFVALDNGTVADVSFTGAGCAISKASASLMTEKSRGMTIQEVEEVYCCFKAMLNGETVAEVLHDTLGELCAFSGISEFPVRIKCATLAWQALHDALNGELDQTTTE